MTRLTDAEVEKVAHLARLYLTNDEKAQYQEQLSAVLEYMEMIDELELEAVPPTAHAVARHNVFGPDDVRSSMDIVDVLYNAPAQAENQFLIQAVLDD